MDKRTYRSRAVKVLSQQTLLAQGVTVSLALLQIVFLARFLSTDDFAKYGVLTAIWAIGNAVIGTSIGARVVRTTVSNSTKISLTAREIVLILSASSIGFFYALVVWQNWLLGVVSAITTASFVIAEARSSLELGRRHFNAYFLIISLKATMPVVVIAVAATLASNLTLTTAMMAILTANLAASAIRPRSAWHLRLLKDEGAPLEWIGLLNLALWIISGVGRIAMDGTVTAVDLAVFTLSYSLTDRAFRALQNAYIAKNISFAFSGKIMAVKPAHWLVTFALFGSCTAALPLASKIISGGRYETPWHLALWISSAGALMYASAPFYLRIVALGRLKLAAVVSLAIASSSVVSNFILITHLGVNGASAILAISYGLWLVISIMISRIPRHLKNPEINNLTESTLTHRGR
ncbi:lipopolysaccharide biosynthesis protein [Rhodococcoides fascians]|uniref:lipopolysaccharide biosynthesis protein n=1 Tax=Rhodococcoides fascians TaxID=1828 RepID=UPI0012D2D188|nr:hypothetical protein [Rhodococcus fascians]